MSDCLHGSLYVQGRQTELSVFGVAMPDKREASYLGRWSRSLSCSFRHGAKHDGVLQVDDEMCLHHTVDQGGMLEQCTGMARVSCPGQREPW